MRRRPVSHHDIGKQKTVYTLELQIKICGSKVSLKFSFAINGTIVYILTVVKHQMLVNLF